MQIHIHVHTQTNKLSSESAVHTKTFAKTHTQTPAHTFSQRAQKISEKQEQWLIHLGEGAGELGIINHA